MEPADTTTGPATRACEGCGTPVQVARTGRPVRFCGPTCRSRAHRAARRIEDGPRQEAGRLAAELAEAGRRLAAAVTAGVPDPGAETTAREAITALSALTHAALAPIPSGIEPRNETRDATPAEPPAEPGRDDPDRDKLFDALDDLQTLLRDELPGELGAALADVAGDFTAAWDAQDGNDDPGALAAAAHAVIDGLGDYRHSPATPPGLLHAADRLDGMLPTDRHETRHETEPVPQDTRPVDKTAPVQEIYLVSMGTDYLILADGTRAGWLRPSPGGFEVHDTNGALAATIGADNGAGGAARRAGAALGLLGADQAGVGLGPLHDHLGHAIETSPTALAAWTLLRGRVPGRDDVIVRGRCIGWLQHHPRGGYIACTLEGPVPGTDGASTQETAVIALLRALYAPVPLPDLGPQATQKRRRQARPKRQKPISPYTNDQLAAAATTLPRKPGPDGTYPVIIDGEHLGDVYRSGRHWHAITRPDHRTVIHRAKTRTAAIDRLLATPGPLYGDPADTIVHDLTDQ
jgi:hypothetical protein